MKKLLLLVLVLCFSASASAALVNGYTFDGGNADDGWGGQHGTGGGDVSFAGGVATFDGDGDYITLPDPVGDFGLGDYSVTWWANLVDPEAKTHFMMTGTSGGPGAGVRSIDSMVYPLPTYGWLTQVDDGVMSPYPLGGFPPAGWVHYASVVDRGANTLSQYLNGAFLASVDITGLGDVSSPGEIVMVGMAMNGDQTPNLGYSDLNGMMDEIGFFDEALSVGQINDIMANGLPEPATVCLLGLGGLLLRRRRS